MGIFSWLHFSVIGKKGGHDFQRRAVLSLVSIWSLVVFCGRY